MSRSHLVDQRGPREEKVISPFRRSFKKKVVKTPVKKTVVKKETTN